MTLAMPVWEGRISPVFDVAGHLLVVQVDKGKERSRDQRPISSHSLGRWISVVSEFGVDVVVCGAMSDELAWALAGIGIQVIPWVKGEVDEVVPAYLSDKLADPRFAMPGSRSELEGL